MLMNHTLCIVVYVRTDYSSEGYANIGAAQFLSKANEERGRLSLSTHHIIVL